MISKFVHLHLHTKYSILDGMCRIEEIIENCKKCNMSAVAITDHGNMFGVVDFYTSLISEGIKPIIGIELYIVNDIKNNVREKNHILLLVKNETGYKNLIKLATIANTEGMYYKPSIDKNILREHSEGLICLTSCIKGKIPALIIENNIEEARKEIEDYLKIFGDGNFYFELQYHGLEEEIIVNRAYKDLSKSLSIPLVATNDVHYIKKEDSKIHDILLCIQTGQTIKDTNRMQFKTNEFYFKNYEEMQELFPDDESALQETIDIVNKCHFELPKPPKERPYYMPVYEIADSSLSYENYFEKIAKDCLKNKYKNITPEIKKRFEHELEIIKKMGYAGYFLIVKDIIEYARKLNIPVGPGRGSAAGSLIAYILGITNIDPLKYGLIFERFLNPDRISPPDIDIDFSDEGREKVINYIINKFGKTKVAQIVTFQSLKPRQAIRDVGRVLDVPLKEVDLLAKKVPEGINITFENVITDEEFSNYINKNQTREEIVKYAMRIEGLIRQYSTHAAGIVISPDDLLNIVPLTLAREGDDERKKGELAYMTQYSMEFLEKLGLLKFDILGLRNLTVINKTIQFIKENKNIEVNFNNCDYSDKKVYELLSDGNTMGVFQLEGESMRDILIKIKPVSFEEIIAIIALYRPGPMRMIDDYINRKKGNITKIEGLEELKDLPFLKETYGIPIYQEQVMQIAVTVAGFTLSEADNLRRIMAKKKISEMEKIKTKFIEGAIKNKYDKRKAELIFEKLEQFAEYGFNKSHAAAYAVLSYQTAYLKAFYPLEFFTALLTSVLDKTDKIAEYIEDAKRNNIKILPPDINKSDVEFKIEKNTIRYALAAIKNVGILAATDIVNTRKESGDFKDLFDFCSKVNTRTVTSKTIESLIKSGAFDFTLLSRAQLYSSMEYALKEAEIKHKNSILGQGFLFEVETNRELPQVKEWDDSEMLNYEKEVLGFYMSRHPLARYEKLLKNISIPIKDLKNFNVDDEVIVAGIIFDLKSKLTNQGKENIHFSLEDLTGKLEVIVTDRFPREKKELFNENSIIMIRGNLSFYDNNIYLFAKSAITLDEAYNFCKFLHIRVREIGLENIELNEIKNVLLQEKGDAKVIFHIITKNNKEFILDLPDDKKVKISEELISKLENIIGENNAWISWKK